jgi:Lrp/AsnC family transcriptional regulator, leucine-responsive regulatory protein
VLDDVNTALLRELARDGRRTVRALAAEVGMSEPAVRDRLTNLERAGVITGYRVVLDPAEVGAGIAAFVALRFGPGTDVKTAVTAALEREPCVLEVHEVAGEDCYLVKVRVGSTTELADALDRIRSIPGMVGTRSTVVLRTLLERPVDAG